MVKFYLWDERRESSARVFILARMRSLLLSLGCDGMEDPPLLVSQSLGDFLESGIS
jgi:hypothetical protein